MTDVVRELFKFICADQDHVSVAYIFVKLLNSDVLWYCLILLVQCVSNFLNGSNHAVYCHSLKSYWKLLSTRMVHVCFTILVPRSNFFICGSNHASCYSFFVKLLNSTVQSVVLFVSLYSLFLTFSSHGLSNRAVRPFFGSVTTHKKTKTAEQYCTQVQTTDILLYRRECFTGNYTTSKIYTKLHPGP